LIKKIYGSVKRWLNYSISFELSPLSCVEKTNAGLWQWFGSDPQLALLPNTNVALKGYYMLEVSITDLKSSVNACFFAGNLQEFYEENSFNLPISRIAPGSKTLKRICYLNGHFNSFRFDPSDESGDCKHLSIKLIKLPGFRAKQLMLKKLVNKQCAYTTTYENYNALFNKVNICGYKSWLKKNEAVEKLSNHDTAHRLANLEAKPLISIICPVYNTKSEWLIACVESIKNQNYTHWELVLVDDASPNQAHFGVLRDYVNSDSRIKTVYLDKNSHISAATNIGIQQASGDYVLFLDHDDELARDALLEVCSVISDNPSAKIIYSDEDLMSEAGERITPHFKSDWNVELLRAHNYVTHLCCYEMTILKSLGGMRLGYEGAQDYDLILRASLVVDPKLIHHIPKVLYHWRMVEGSTALSSDAKSYATDAGLKALKDYMLQSDTGAQVEHAARDNFYTVNYPLPTTLPKVSVIIPTRDGMDVLRPCIETLLAKTDYPSYEVVILDNGSTEKETLVYLEALSLKSNFTIVRDDGEFNYSRINNHAVTYANGDLVCLLNNDIEIIQPNWLSEMVSIAVRKDVGCVGAKLLYPDGTIQHAGVILGLGGYAAHSHRGIGGTDAGYFCRAQVRQQLSAVTGACLLIKRDIFDEVSGLDEAFQVAYNDVDFCLRVQALGYQNIYTPFSELIHHESKTRGEDTGTKKTKRFDKEKALLLSRWSSQIKNDPFYNPNLTRDSEDFAIGNTSAK
jgi:GT2 family glycosyltransferase